MMDPDKVEIALNAFVMTMSLLILFGYFMQAVVGFYHAARRGILRKIFSGFIHTWITVATIFFGPLMISLASDVVNLLDEQEMKMTASFILSMLMIFITLEFVQIASLNDRNGNWLPLLLIALFLDIVCVVLINAIIHNSSQLINLLFAFGVFAFVSSFMIILFAKVAEKIEVTDYPHSG